MTVDCRGGCPAEQVIEHLDVAAVIDELRSGVDEGSERKAKRSVADQLVAIATTDAELFHGRDDVCYAVIPTDAGEETWNVRSKRFRAWLATGTARSMGKPWFAGDPRRAE